MKAPKGIFIVLGALSLFLVAIFAERTITNSGQASRLATIEALVVYKTYSIDHTIKYWINRDVSMIQGHYYSPKPPILSTIAAIGYFFYSQITGNTFREDTEAAIHFHSVMFGLIPHCLLLIYFYMFLQLWIEDSRAQIWAFACIAFGYLGVGYAPTLNNHSSTAALLIISFYYGFLLRTGRSDKTLHWILAGFLSSLVAAFDHPSAIFSLALFFYLLAYNPRKALLIFIPAALPVLALNAFINFSISGSIKPIQEQWKTFRFPGSYWAAPMGIDSLREPKRIYAFHTLLGHHGFFTMSPVLFFSLPALWACLKPKHERFREALLVFAPTLIMILFYVFRTRNYGGHNVGFRWLIPAMPPLLLFTAVWLEKKPSKAWMAVFTVCLIIGFLNVFDAFLYAWKEPSFWAWLFYPPPWDQ